MTRAWPNGYPRTRATYVSATDEDGRVLHGPYRAWYEDGQPSEEGLYDQGKREGSWFFWTPSGELNPELSGMYSGGFLVEGSAH